MRIRPAGWADVEAVAAIETQSFSNPWRAEDFRALLGRWGALFLVVEEGGEVVGYAVAWWVLEEGELANIAVREQNRGKGVGAALLDRVLEELLARGVRKVFLEVRISNERAIGLYRSRGFTRLGVRRGYYQNPTEDGWVLVCDLARGKQV